VGDFQTHLSNQSPILAWTRPSTLFLPLLWQLIGTQTQRGHRQLLALHLPCRHNGPVPGAKPGIWLDHHPRTFQMHPESELACVTHLHCHSPVLTTSISACRIPVTNSLGPSQPLFHPQLEGLLEPQLCLEAPPRAPTSPSEGWRLPSLLTPLQALWPPCCSSMSCGFFYLRAFAYAVPPLVWSPRPLCTHSQVPSLTSFRRQLRCHPRAFSDSEPSLHPLPRCQVLSFPFVSG
jgi:hypothetical protein